MLEIPVSLFAPVFLSIVVGKVSLAIRACMASQFSIVSLVSIVSLGSLAILVSLALLVSVSPLAIRLILVSFLFTYFTILSDISLFCRIDEM